MYERLCGKQWRPLAFGLVAGFATVVAPASHADVEDKVVAGWIEEARLMPGDVVLEVKLDTGAEHSSLHTKRIHEFKRKGKRWVRFDVIDHDGEKVTVERLVRRYALIKGHRGDRDTRPVVKLEICLGGVERRVEVNLVDRSGFEYPMLIGRSFLEGEFVVDPDLEKTLALDCEEDEDSNARP